MSKLNTSNIGTKAFSRYPPEVSDIYRRIGERALRIGEIVLGIMLYELIVNPTPVRAAIEQYISGLR